MNKNIFLFFISSIFFNISFSQNCPLAKEYFKFNSGWYVTDTTEYSLYNNVRDTFNHKIFKKGNGIIFTYTAHYDCPNMYDEEQTDALTWSIPDSSTSFKLILTKDNFNSLSFSYMLAQFGYNRSKRMLSGTGEISGIKKEKYGEFQVH